STKNYFGHKDSLGRDPFVRMAAFGYNYTTTKGENLAAGYSDAARTFNQWKNSPGHNAAMLNTAFKVIGITRLYVQHSNYQWDCPTDFGGDVDATFDGRATGAGKNVKTVHPANHFQTILNALARCSRAAFEQPLECDGPRILLANRYGTGSGSDSRYCTIDSTNPEIWIKSSDFPSLILTPRY